MSQLPQTTLPPGGAPTPRWPVRLLQLTSVLAVCLLTRGWLVAHTAVIAPDGTTYIEMARRWEHDAAAVIREYASSTALRGPPLRKLWPLLSDMTTGSTVCRISTSGAETSTGG